LPRFEHVVNEAHRLCRFNLMTDRQLRSRFKKARLSAIVGGVTASRRGN